MKKKVLVGMSGGVDSSVTAALLLEFGYEVLGVTIAPFDTGVNESTEVKAKWRKSSVEDAENVCKQLNIEHFVFDFSSTFRDNVVDYFVREYLSGRTPNPCVHCNPIIKWGLLLEKACELGADFLATGHYARIVNDPKTNKYFVRKGADVLKDQSYFLWKLSSQQLSRTIFPLGEMTKEQTRKKAESLGLAVYKKAESQEVCFIRDNDYHNFLRRKIENIDDIVPEGDILFNGKSAGKHKGFAYYTIGQRKGLGVTYKDPLYVTRIDAENNIVEIGENDSLLTKTLTIKNSNFTKYDQLDENQPYLVKIRYKDRGTQAICKHLPDNRMEINFFSEVRAVTPGQSVVIYEDQDLIGGGVIE